MNFQFTSLMLITLSMGACSGGGGGNSAPKPSTRTPINTDNSTNNTVTPPCVPSAANNNCQQASSIVDKCWAEIFDTATAKTCAAAGKMYNRVQDKCVESGITLKTPCSASDLPAADLAKVLADMNALHPDSNPQLDQCGTYTVDSKTYNVYYFMGKKYTGGTDGRGSYEGYFSCLGASPSASNPICKNPDILLSTITPQKTLTCGGATGGLPTGATTSGSTTAGSTTSGSVITDPSTNYPH